MRFATLRPAANKLKLHQRSRARPVWSPRLHQPDVGLSGPECASPLCQRTPSRAQAWRHHPLNSGRPATPNGPCSAPSLG